MLRGSYGVAQRTNAPLPDATGDVRVAPLLAIPSLLTDLGADPAAVFARAGIELAILRDPENRLSFLQIGRLLQACVEATGREHFGLLIGQQFTLPSLGVLGELMRNCATLRDALRMAALHLEIHDRGAVSLAVDVDERQAALGYTLLAGDIPAAGQILDGAIAMQHLLLRELAGRSWKPLRIQLSHGRPAKAAPYTGFFGTRVEFDAPYSGIVFDSHWLDHPIAGADPQAYAAIVATIEAAASRDSAPLTAQVRRALLAMTFTGTASMANVARLFDLSPRTLRRRLVEEGSRERDIGAGVRRELSLHLLRNTDLPVSEVAAMLCYSDLTVFSRAFRGWTGESPRRWRVRRASEASAGRQ